MKTFLALVALTVLSSCASKPPSDDAGDRLRLTPSKDGSYSASFDASATPSKDEAHKEFLSMAASYAVTHGSPWFSIEEEKSIWRHRSDNNHAYHVSSVSPTPNPTASPGDEPSAPSNYEYTSFYTEGFFQVTARVRFFPVPPAAGSAYDARQILNSGGL